MLPRLFRTLAFTIALTVVCLLLSPTARVLLAVPAVLLTGYLTLVAFVDRGLIRALASKARARLGYRPASVQGK
jgi:hypothetical protein